MGVAGSSQVLDLCPPKKILLLTDLSPWLVAGYNDVQWWGAVVSAATIARGVAVVKRAQYWPPISGMPMIKGCPFDIGMSWAMLTGIKHECLVVWHWSWSINWVCTDDTWELMFFGVRAIVTNYSCFHFSVESKIQKVTPWRQLGKDPRCSWVAAQLSKHSSSSWHVAFNFVYWHVKQAKWAKAV